jgi:hypothetical protein
MVLHPGSHARLANGRCHSWAPDSTVADLHQFSVVDTLPLRVVFLCYHGASLRLSTGVSGLAGCSLPHEPRVDLVGLVCSTQQVATAQLNRKVLAMSDVLQAHVLRYQWQDSMPKAGFWILGFWRNTMQNWIMTLCKKIYCG